MFILEKNKIVLIFSEKNKMLLTQRKKEESYSLAGPYLHVQNVRKNKIIACSPLPLMSNVQANFEKFKMADLEL